MIAATAVGAGSYTTDPIGPLPSGCGTVSTNPRQFVTAHAPTGAIPTNDWWSSLVFKRLNCQYSENLEAHPLSYLPNANGLGFSYSTTAQLLAPAPGLQEYHYPYSQDFTAGVSGLNAPIVKVDGWSDWTVTPAWSDGARTMTATIGHGLPFTYIDVTGGGALLTATSPLRVWRSTGASVGFTVNGHDYVAFAPTGATWRAAGTTVTSTLAGKGYYSVAVLPTTGSSTDAQRNALAAQFSPFAYAKITGTTLGYRYDQASSTVTTTYRFATTPWEGTETRTVAALYPHQWTALTGSQPIPQRYVSPRGPMKVLVGASSFTTSMVFHGVLPEVPAVADNAGADRATLNTYLRQVAGDPMAQQKADTYWSGKGMGRAARLAEIADQIGDTATRDKALSAIRTTLTDWFTASPGKTAQVFYYDKNWGTLIGYPASYGSDQELNDHHFHYGYFIAAAATLAKFDPAWASTGKYGGMVDLLIRDANNYVRTDTRFPYLRDFDIYAGHDWASGHGAFAAGNNQESSSEGMNFDNALIQWGQATGNTAVRDAGIFMYTTQAQAIANYWFDVNGTAFPTGWEHSAVGMVWGDGGSYATWFSPDPEKIQGINMLPVTGGHLYLGYQPAYVKKNYAEIVKRAGGPPREWQDIIWSFLATGDPAAALTNFRANPTFVSEEGETKAHTFHWIDNLAALGVIDTTVTANNPLAVVFTKNGARTYVASNVTAAPLTVTFSDRNQADRRAGQDGDQWRHHLVRRQCDRRPAARRQHHAGVDGADGADVPTVPTVPPPTVPTEPPGTSATLPPTSVTPTSVTPPSTASATRYLGSGGVLADRAAVAAAVTLQPSDGATHDGTPYHPSVFTASGLTMGYHGESTAFSLAVDSGSAIGNAVQVRVSYDLTGNGSWDRVETFRYFATDPVPGAERYTQNAGVVGATGQLGDLTGGTVQVEIWSALPGGSNPATIGADSSVALPYS